MLFLLLCYFAILCYLLSCASFAIVLFCYFVLFVILCYFFYCAILLLCAIVILCYFSYCAIWLFCAICDFWYCAICYLVNCAILLPSMECFLNPRTIFKCVSFGAILLWIVCGSYVRYESGGAAVDPGGAMMLFCYSCFYLALFFYTLPSGLGPAYK